MKYLTALTFILIYMFSSVKLGYSLHSPWYTHITYMFQHAGLIHLAVNILSFITVAIFMQRIYKRWYFFLLPFIIAAATSFIPLTIATTPTVGASGIIYAIIGMITPYYKLKQSPMFFLAIAISLVVSFFLPNTNFYLHLFCFAAGLICGSFKYILYVKTKLLIK